MRKASRQGSGMDEASRQGDGMGEANQQGDGIGEASTLDVYKCPSCGGAVGFDATTGSLACKWCGNTYDPGNLEPKRVSAELAGYLCPECGAQLMADDFIVADTCPYCGNNEIALQRFEDDFRPDYVIPFALTKRQAIECYESTLAQKLYLPDDFVSHGKIISVQGTYVPFWLLSGVLDFDYTYVTTRHKSKGGSVVHRHRRAGTYEFNRLPADGSQHMPDDMMDSIEPYDYGALVPFSPEYLPGFIAERYTIGPDSVNERIDLRLTISASREAQKTITEYYSSIRGDKDHFTYITHRDRVDQALMPVWLIVISYNGRKYLVGVNGQTGKVAANLPIDEGKQRRAARRMTPKGMLPLAPILLFPCLVFSGYAAYDLGFDVLAASLAGIMGGSPPEDAVTFRSTICFVAGIVIGVILMLIVARGAYKDAKERIRQSMQNVEESIDASRFSTMTITQSEPK